MFNLPTNIALLTDDQKETIKYLIALEISRLKIRRVNAMTISTGISPHDAIPFIDNSEDIKALEELIKKFI